MSIWRRAQPVLPPGVYDEIVSESLAAQLASMERTHAVEVADVGKDCDVDEQLVTLVRDAARIAIASRGDAREKIAVARELLGHLTRDGSFRLGETILREQLLRGIAVRVPGGAAAPGSPPRGSLLSSGLITNAHGESVLSHLASEFASVDRIDLLCSFIKLSGLDKFRPLIERHRALGRPLRVLTTTYMRATEVKAIELLHRLGAEVRVSYDDATTRLHAKSWLFHRESEYSTAYVGSSNLSHAAQTEGLEWSLRIAQADQPDLFDEMRAVFDTYWVDADRFEPFDGTDAASRRLLRALTEPDRSTFVGFDLEPKDAATTRGDGKYRHFYTGVEPVCDGRYDLLLVTLDKGDQKHEHLQYADFPLTETRFQWQSKSRTRADSEDGLRHLEPAASLLRNSTYTGATVCNFLLSVVAGTLIPRRRGLNHPWPQTPPGARRPSPG